MQTLLRHFEPETLTQNRRVQDGGGKIIDSFYVNQMIRRLKEQGLYLNGTADCKFIGDANMGVTLDGSNACSKEWDFSGYNNDALQATGSAMPIWTAAQQNGKAGLVHSGTYNYLRKAFTLAQPVTAYVAHKSATWRLGGMLIDGAVDISMVIQQYPTPAPNISIYAGGGTQSVNITIANGETAIASALFSGSSSWLRKNAGSKQVDVTVGTASPGGLTIANQGTPSAGSQAIIITLGVILINADVPAGADAALLSLQNAYYAIY